ncbi:response regulator transcription factor CtrA [Rubellimicrobium aerolatum]|uniref:Response regulator transcription factor CtrA n=1 Tax=Rubellimicrobium aerolatum TaxID=490979 RepID=A0ABW0SHI6_9RHOB|nr:response regulator transcription factor [Rubellimicrobium aerolatum]MBP1807792.1 two-component system cell cycle response regulator CtrA [Rubellimicrobium aerolatum]
MRILVVDDDPITQRSIAMLLQQARLNPFTTGSGEEALDLAKMYDYDLIVLDLNMPDLSGHEVLRRLRQSKIQTPVLILTGYDSIDSKLKGFGWGADDYLTKPFERAEFLARIQAIVRRSKGHAQSVIRLGRLSVNLDSKTVQVDGESVYVTGKEYQMIELLALRKGSTVTKEMFLNYLYGGIDEPELKIIDVFICKLRRKLAAALGHNPPIETIWGRGYMIRDVAESVRVIGEGRSVA